ncbi:GDSL-like Lipase/Acylhydrolase-domain-containing protein [Lipomyces japonicus]|uniref:GDSL-like Lipase/Acylhydrolase-domain-containing protein n=1 Tax=Lipomyces japonicus TaxID=56871 RepID=UPI0034CE75E8
MKVSPLLSIVAALPAVLADKNIFIFGDSYSDTGFNVNYTLPNINNAFGNPNIHGTFGSNGINWLKYLATSYNSSIYYVYDFARGGATVDNAIVTLHDYIPSFVEQVESMFLPYMTGTGQVASWSAQDTIVGVWFGINDILNSYLVYSEAQLEVVYNQEIAKSYWSAIETIYKAGARDFFFMLVPPINLRPNLRTSTRPTVKSAVQEFNSMVTAGAAEFSAGHSDATTTVIDINSLFVDLISNYQSYGFDNVTGYCEAYIYGVPFGNTYYSTCPAAISSYFWLNSVHVTTEVHRYVAQAVALLLEQEFGLEASNVNASLDFIKQNVVADVTVSSTLEIDFTTLAATEPTAVTSKLSKPFGKVWVVQE